MKLTVSALGLCDAGEEGGSTITLAHKRSQCPKTRPSCPRPRLSSSSRNDLSSSFCSCNFLFFSTSVLTGSARTHLCITVHMFGVGERDAIGSDSGEGGKSATGEISP